MHEINRTIHFSGLNGIRALAALAVVFSHTTIALGEFGLDSYILGRYADGNPKTTLLAGFGVSIFFALSGFLITYLLLMEREAGGINVKHFYIRRILRIWPLYYLYLLLAYATALLYDMPLYFASSFFYVFMLANVPFILGRMIGLLGHYWSLGVEEQFYSFWPWVVAKSKSILTVTVSLCVLLIVVTSVTGYFSHKLPGNSIFDWIHKTLHVTRFQCMLIGATGAILYFQKNNLFMRLTDNLVAQLIVWIVIVLVATNHFHIISLIDNELISVATVFLIIGQIQKSNRIVNLDSGLMDFVGKISYGIYVIHPLVIFYLSRIIIIDPDRGIWNYCLIYVLVFSATIGLAYLSFNFFEKKFLDLKDRYSTVRSSVSK